VTIEELRTRAEAVLEEVEKVIVGKHEPFVDFGGHYRGWSRF